MQTPVWKCVHKMQITINDNMFFSKAIDVDPCCGLIWLALQSLYWGDLSPCPKLCRTRRSPGKETQLNLAEVMKCFFHRPHQWNRWVMCHHNSPLERNFGRAYRCDWFEFNFFSTMACVSINELLREWLAQKGPQIILFGTGWGSLTCAEF